MKLLGSNESKTAKDKNGKNVPHLETTVLVLCNIINNDYQQDSREFCIHLFLIKHLAVY